MDDGRSSLPGKWIKLDGCLKLTVDQAWVTRGLKLEDERTCIISEGGVEDTSSQPASQPELPTVTGEAISEVPLLLPPQTLLDCPSSIP
ncbi:hypothetical protein Pmani_024878 [Petrolisthes manimaculis]|uniref:Uncharacterized protein n=1 Tax=Petrolisthes manimaculis TaxID=1843537 RepID=A0AAE1P8C1_9EUCA|nr:hypothetical protein Pmani_024878 [Petrolisthes manimaculis]